MERSQEQLLELTKCGLWGGDLNQSLFKDGVDWDVVLRLAKEQTLLGLLSLAIEKLPLESRPTRVLTLKLHQMVTLNRQYRAHHIVVLGEVLEMLRSFGVERPVLLKGLGVGLNYADPTLRQCGDLDIYVGDNHYFRVWGILCDKFGIVREKNHSDHHFDFDFMETHIEIHRYATAPSSVAFRSDEFMAWSREQLDGDELRRVSIEGVEVLLPPYNFDFIFIFYHMWRHLLTGGIGLRQLCDWSCYVSSHADKFDCEVLSTLISRFRLERPISLFATIAVRSLGVDPKHFEGLVSTSEKDYLRVLDQIWRGGNFGFYREGRKGRVDTLFQRKCRSLKFQLLDLRFMLGIDWIYSIKFYTPFFAERIVNAFRHRRELGDKL